MKKVSVLMVVMALVMGLSLISRNSSSADISLYEQERGQAIENAIDLSFDVVQTSAYKVQNPRQELRVREGFGDELQMTHVRLEQIYEGLRVFEGELITHFKADGAVSSITGTFYNDINISTTPRLSASEAIAIAANNFGHGLSSEPTAELMIFPKAGKYFLAYRTELVDINSDNPADRVYFISAKTGKVLFQYDNLENGAAVGTGSSLYSGSVSLNTNSISSGFEMRDLTRGSAYTADMKNKQGGNPTIFTDTDNIWGSGSNTNRASAGVDAHYGIQKTYDYYNVVHGRQGIANNGVGAYNRVHYGRNYNNAYWSDSCFCMTYGDGDGNTFSPLVSIDVAGHEMSHGVTSRTARLTYSGESGGLNEATSDIFGTCVEFYANNANDAGDYLIGEKITLRKLASGDPGTGKYLRSMVHPKYDGRSPDFYYSGIGSLDVHYSSGLANNFFYLLSEGGTNDTSHVTVSGITRAKAEKIWYRALTVYFTSSTNYAAARVATLLAAADLYGSGGTEYTAVAATWAACGVN
jgi:zinc metalloprotease ZmpA